MTKEQRAHELALEIVRKCPLEESELGCDINSKKLIDLYNATYIAIMEQLEDFTKG